MPEFAKLKEPKPAETSFVNEEVGKVTFAYDRQAMDVAAIGSTRTPIKIRLSCVMLGWDMTVEGKRLQPVDLANTEHWRNVVADGRKMAHKLWTDEKSRRDTLTAKELKRQNLPPLDAEPIQPHAAITFQHMRDAYNAEWMAILAPFPDEFLLELDTAVYDHFLEERRRNRQSKTS